MKIRFAVLAALFAFVGAIVGGVPKPVSADGKRIAVMWVGDSMVARSNLRGFLPRVKEIAPDISVTVKMDLANMETAEKLFREFESTMDGIVFLRSNGAEFLAKAAPKKPCFVGAANDPRLLGVIKNPEAPEGFITGVTYYVPYDKRFDAIKLLFPNVKNVALLMEKDHPGIPIERKGTQEECQKRGLGYHEIIGGTTEQLVQGAKQDAGKVDLFLLAVHALVEKSTPELASVSRAAKVPIFSYADAPITRGALAGLAAREDLLGKMLAESVADIVVKGKPVSQVPVKTDPDPEVTVNEGEMLYFNLKLPPSLIGKARMIRKQ